MDRFILIARDGVEAAYNIRAVKCVYRIELIEDYRIYIEFLGETPPRPAYEVYETKEALNTRWNEILEILRGSKHGI